MSMNDPLASVLSNILNYEKNGRSIVYATPCSTIIKATLKIFNEKGFIGKYEEIKDGKANILKINLLGKINKCGVIKPRFAIKSNSFEKYEKRFLPAIDFGVLIVTTNKGIMTHTKAKEQNLGGKLVAYCY